MNTSDQNSMNHQSHQQGMNPYVKFTLMILTSTIVMFIMMYFKGSAQNSEKIVR